MIELIQCPKCPRCGRPHPIRVGFEPVDDFICSDCFNQEHWVEKTFAAGLHGGVLRDAIHLLKYRKKRMLAGPLAQLLFQAVAAKVDLRSYDMLVPVPLHRNRLKERGFNQSELIGSHLCKETGVLLAPVLERVKDTPSFSRLGAPERHKLIRKAFELDSKAEVKKKRVLLIDDVVTTGATSSECARVLRKKGAAAVDVIALAVVGRL
jgi:ComF family protein